MGVRREALLEADNGRLREAADLTRAAMTESGYARGILADLTHGLWGLPRTFIGRADMIADLDDSPERVGQWRTMFPEPDTIRLMSWGITLGVGLGQMRKRYGAAAGNDYPISPDEAADGSYKRPLLERPVGAHDTRILRTWDPKYLRSTWWDESWYLMTADGEIRIDPNDGEWMLYLPYGEIKPWEYGAWRSLTIAFVLARDSMFDRSRHAEVLAPVRVGKVPQGTTEKQRRLYLDQIRKMQRMAAFVLPPGLEYTVVESSGRIADIYDKIIEWAEREYAMITGAITTATGSPGFSKGDVQERFTRSILSSFGSSLMSCLHAGGLVPWAKRNYGSPDAPRAEVDATPPEDKKSIAETVGIAGESLTKMADGLERHGFELTPETVERFAQKLGFEVSRLPDKTRAPRIDIKPEAREYAYTLREVRAADGYDPIGDDRDDLTIAEAEQLAKQKAEAPPEEALPDGGADAGEPPTDESAAALAVAMTHHALERCEHGACNRCRLCGVERERGFSMGPDGVPTWKRAWRPILRPRPAPTNGIAALPMLGIGGDA